MRRSNGSVTSSAPSASRRCISRSPTRCGAWSCSAGRAPEALAKVTAAEAKRDRRRACACIARGQLAAFYRTCQTIATAWLRGSTSSRANRASTRLRGLSLHRAGRAAAFELSLPHRAAMHRPGFLERALAQIPLLSVDRDVRREHATPGASIPGSASVSVGAP